MKVLLSKSLMPAAVPIENEEAIIVNICKKEIVNSKKIAESTLIHAALLLIYVAY